MATQPATHLTVEQYLGIERAAEFRSEYIGGGMFATAGGGKPAQVVTYPDAIVFCEPAEFLDGDRDTLVDATVILEVRSRSTQNYDRGEKFRSYRSLPSFREYVLLAKDEIRAEHHVRQPDSSWLFRELKGPESDIHLESIGCRLTLGALYERAEF